MLPPDIVSTRPRCRYNWRDSIARYFDRGAAPVEEKLRGGAEVERAAGDRRAAGKGIRAAQRWDRLDPLLTKLPVPVMAPEKVVPLPPTNVNGLESTRLVPDAPLSDPIVPAVVMVTISFTPLPGQAAQGLIIGTGRCELYVIVEL